MSSELPGDHGLPPNFEPIPHFVDPLDQQHLQDVLKDPIGVPVHHRKIDVEKRFEAITSASSLPGDYTWFLLGLAYCLIKVDRSLIEAFQSAMGKNVPLLTHQSAHPLVYMRGSDAWSRNPWSGIVQGIPHEHAQAFVDYVVSFKFHKADTGEDWCCGFQETQIMDPFLVTTRVALPVVNLWVATPQNLTLGRRVSQATPMVNGNPPVFGITSKLF
jgi:hypothetical protein